MKTQTLKTETSEEQLRTDLKHMARVLFFAGAVAAIAFAITAILSTMGLL